MSVWSNLKFTTGISVLNNSRAAAGSIGYRWLNSNSPIGNVQFKSKSASVSVVARVAQQMAMQITEAELNKFLPRLKRQTEYRRRKEYLDIKLKENDNSFTKLINKGTIATDPQHGKITTSDSKEKIIAQDYLGREVPEALILSYQGKEMITYNFPAITKSQGYKMAEQKFLQKIVESSRSVKIDEDINEVGRIVTTNDVIHIDLNPDVTFSTNKNLVMTAVQGRDYTRKELIGGGDLTFSVSGSVVSNLPGVYPTNAVQRLIKIAQHKDIINVHHYFFDQFNVNRIIIKDFNLDRQEFKNIQPYSFTCVAVEADDIQIATQDTIGQIDRAIGVTPLSNWERLILNNKLVELGAKAVANTTSSVINKGLDLEGLISNI